MMRAVTAFYAVLALVLLGLAVAVAPYGLSSSDGWYLYTLAHPELLYLSTTFGWLGGWIGGLFGGSPLGYRLLTLAGLVLCSGLLAHGVVRFWRARIGGAMDQRIVAASVWCGALFHVAIFPMTFNYNTVSSLAAPAAAGFLLLSLASTETRARAGWLVGAGIVTGLAGFGRLPGAVGIGLTLALAHFLGRRSVSRSGEAALLTLYLATATLTFVGLSQALGEFSDFTRMLARVANPERSTHANPAMVIGKLVESSLRFFHAAIWSKQGIFNLSIAAVSALILAWPGAGERSVIVLAVLTLLSALASLAYLVVTGAQLPPQPLLFDALGALAYLVWLGRNTTSPPWAIRPLLFLFVVLLATPFVAQGGSAIGVLWTVSMTYGPLFALFGLATVAAVSAGQSLHRPAMAAAMAIIMAVTALHTFHGRLAYLADLVGRAPIPFARIEASPALRGLLVPEPQARYLDALKRMIDGITADGGRYRVVALYGLSTEALASGLRAFGSVAHDSPMYEELSCAVLDFDRRAPGERMVMLLDAEPFAETIACLTRNGVHYPEGFREVGRLVKPPITAYGATAPEQMVRVLVEVR
jgi:hypothetical protein